MLFHDDIFENINLNVSIEKNPKILKVYPETWYVSEKNLILAECYLLLKRQINVEFNGCVFENVDGNY